MQAVDGPNSSQLEWHQDGVKTTFMELAIDLAQELLGKPTGGLRHKLRPLQWVKTLVGDGVLAYVSEVRQLFR
jgi:hypothetical protein